MCFFMLRRWRTCGHDDIVKTRVVAYCSRSKARAREEMLYSIFCGDGMLSPNFIAEYNFEDISGGVCPVCICGMGKLAERTPECGTPPPPPPPPPSPIAKNDGNGNYSTATLLTGRELVAAYQKYCESNMPVDNETSTASAWKEHAGQKDSQLDPGEQNANHPPISQWLNQKALEASGSSPSFSDQNDNSPKRSVSE